MSRCIVLVALAVLLPGMVFAVVPSIQFPGGSLTLNVGGNEVLRATKDGYVGIGTASPTTALEVSGTVSATHFVGDGSGLTGIGGGSGDAITSGTTKVTVNSATSTISFTTAGSVANYIDSSGRLVTTGISVTTNQLSATTGYFSKLVEVGTNDTTFPFQVISDSGVASGEHIIAYMGNVPEGGTNAGAKIGYYADGAAVTAGIVRAVDSLPLYLGTSSQKQLITLLDGGNVGIGTTSPQSRLDIATNDWNVFDDMGYSTNFPLNIHDVQPNNGYGTGIAFSITSDPNDVGGAIVFKRTGGSAKGELEFWTKQNTDQNGSPTQVMVLSDSGKVGIGTTNPTTALEVSGTVSATAANMATLQNNSLSGNTAAFNSVGIGASPSATNVLYVSGTVFITSTTYAYAFLYPSDKRLKTDITPLRNATERLARIQPVRFHYIKDGPDGRLHVGFIAQELEQEYPEAVYTDANGMKQVDYPSLVAPLWQANRELQERLHRVESAIEKLDHHQSRRRHSSRRVTSRHHGAQQG